MGLVYRDSPKTGASPIAFFRDGVVYDRPPGERPKEMRYEDDVPDNDPKSWGANTIGYYEDGAIFRNQPLWGSDPIGYYQDDNIYEDDPLHAEPTPIGYCKDGAIYNVPPDSETSPVGYYEGPCDGAAAAAKLLGLIASAILP
jgi:hypothetical protein